jgi:multicomponent Na+:H+ antiporter subunit A
MITVSTVVGLAGYVLLSETRILDALSWSRLSVYEWVFAILVPLAAMLAVLSRSRLTAVAALGVVGYGLALIYLLYGAPDLAMTQFAIETLTVVLFVLVLYRLPPFARFSSWIARVRDAAVALAAGALMTGLLLVTTAAPLKSLVAPYFAENSLPQAHGRNVVNVILVDFRALDTLGEITVLAVAAVGVFALIGLVPGKKEEDA